MKQRRIGYKKADSPQEAIKLMKALRTQLGRLESQIVIKEKETLINISREVTFSPNYSQGKITGFHIFHKCWCVGSLWFSEMPDFRAQDHYKIEWVNQKVRILWDGRR
jgi:hypothetical protein